MDKKILEMMDGFEFTPIYHLKSRTTEIGMLGVDFLSNGYVIGHKLYKDVTVQEVEELIKKFVTQIRKNQNLCCDEDGEKDFKKIEVINMFRIHELVKKDGNLFDVKIDMIKNGYFYVCVSFAQITEEQLKNVENNIKEMLRYNLTVENVCQAMTWMDLYALCK